MHRYRTTFTAKAQVAKAIKEKAKREGKSISEIVNELLLEALGLQPGRAKVPFRVVAHNLKLRPGLDPTRMSLILEDLGFEDWDRSQT